MCGRLFACFLLACACDLREEEEEMREMDGGEVGEKELTPNNKKTRQAWGYFQ